MIVCPLSLHSAYTLSLNQVAIDKKDKHLKEGLNGGGGRGFEMSVVCKIFGH